MSIKQLETEVEFRGAVWAVDINLELSVNGWYLKPEDQMPSLRESADSTREAH